MPQWPTLTPEQYLSAIRADAGAMVSAARGADLDRPVPACPGWSLYDLVSHMSGVHRWAAEMVRTNATTWLDRRKMPQAPPGPAVVDWLEEGAGLLLSALEAAGPDAPVWSWDPNAGTAMFWFGRQAQETAVHRWDAESAAGGGGPIDAVLAVDGIEELLVNWLTDRDPGQAPVDLGGTLHLHATDVTGEWTVSPGPEGPRVSRGPAAAEATLSGTASDLLLHLWGRPVPGGRVQTSGDPAIPARWGEQMSL